MADKQATPQAEQLRHPDRVISYFQMPGALDAAHLSPVIKIRPLALRAIWRSERGTAAVTSR